MSVTRYTSCTLQTSVTDHVTSPKLWWFQGFAPRLQILWGSPALRASSAPLLPSLFWHSEAVVGALGMATSGSVASGSGLE